MNRTTVAALVTTAVIGVSAGTVTAVVRGEDPAKTPTTAGTDTASPDPAPTTQVLWADDQAIHDGDQEIGLGGPLDEAPDRLVRAKGGYLLGYDNVENSYYDQALYFVSAPQGSVQILSERVRSWDLSPQGDRVVVDAFRNLQVIGFDGVVQATAPAPEGERGVLWNGKAVTVHVQHPEAGWFLWTWDGAGGKPRRTDATGFENARSDRSGEQAVGAVGSEGYAAPDENFCAGTGSNSGTDTGVAWFTCDWRLNGPRTNPVSPEGTRVLVIHAQSDGFGPGAFGIVDMAKGPSGGVPTVDAPDEWMLDAAWVDEERFAVVGSNSDEVGTKGGWVQLCDTAGDCEEVARTSSGRVTLGEQF